MERLFETRPDACGEFWKTVMDSSPPLTMESFDRYWRDFLEREQGKR